jgi:hypothetical protein
MESLWVLILLLVAFCTIVTVRMFVNGAREEAADAAFDELATAETPAAVPSPAPRTARRAAAARAGAAPAATAAGAATEAPATPARGRGSRRAPGAKAAAQPAAWPGGECPNCGSPTVPNAKFCGECGHRLVP